MRRMFSKTLVSVGAVAAMILVPVLLGGQGPPSRDAASSPALAGSSSISGRVTRSDDDKPLRGVQVAVIRALVLRFTTETDADGRFEFAGLPAGRYALTASQAGYITTRYGQSADGVGLALAVEVRDDEHVKDVGVRLSKAGVVAGRVVDQRGNDVTGAQVFVLRWLWDADVGRHLSRVMVGTDRTDDRGEFRLWGIPPGEYLVAVDAIRRAAAGIERRDGPLVTYYPGVQSPYDASVVSIGPDVEVTGITVMLRESVTRRLTGTVLREDGTAASGHRVTVAGNVRGDPNYRMVMTGADGSYVFPAVPEGEYVISASSESTDDRFEGFGAVTVVVAGADAEALLIVRRRSALRGKYVFESTAAAPTVMPPSRPVSTVFIPLDLFASHVGGEWRTGPDYAFEVLGLSGRYRVRPPAPPGWSVKQLRLGAMDVTDSWLEFSGADMDGLEVVLTNRDPQLVGSVALPRDVDPGSFRVVVFAVDSGKWGPGSRYVQVTVPNSSGEFSVPVLPTGEYVVAAVESSGIADETSPDRLERLRHHGESVAIVEGESVAVNLRLVRF